MSTYSSMASSLVQVSIANVCYVTWAITIFPRWLETINCSALWHHLTVFPRHFSWHLWKSSTRTKILNSIKFYDCTREKIILWEFEDIHFAPTNVQLILHVSYIWFLFACIMLIEIEDIWRNLWFLNISTNNWQLFDYSVSNLDILILNASI